MTILSTLKARALGTATAGALVAAAAATPLAAQEFKFRLATIDVETGVYFTNIAKPFAELVSELTKGEVEIQPLPGGTVGSVFKLHEALDDGLVEMVSWTAAYMGTDDPTNAMINTFPTGLGVDSMLAWTYQGGGEKLLTDFRADTMGVHSIVLGAGPSEWFAHSHAEINSVADLEGKKYRTLGNWAAITKEAFNASTTTVPGAEVYSMLEKQGLDMAEYSMPGENWNQGLHETAEYVIYPGIHAPAWTFELMIDPDAWASLPADYQRAIEIAAKLVTYESMNRIIMADMEAVRKINARVDEGKNKLIELSPEFKQNAREAARAWGEKVSAEAAANGNEWPQKVFDSIVKFQDDWEASAYYMATDKP